MRQRHREAAHDPERVGRLRHQQRVSREARQQVRREASAGADEQRRRPPRPRP